MILQKKDILEIIKRKESPLRIEPLLDENQIGELSIDLRLGTDFLVSLNNRHASIKATKAGYEFDTISSFFQETRRRPGELFLLHPNQIVLCTTLEYLRTPNDILTEIRTRNSYNRLGMTVNTVVHPGYCGVVGIELVNNSKHIIELTVGAKIFQAFFHKTSKPSNYFHEKRKYLCSVRPEISAILSDREFEKLEKYRQIINHSAE